MTAQIETEHQSTDLLRFATAGSVDDGKCTLIGWPLLDSKSIFEDQLEAVEATSACKGYDCTDPAPLTDDPRSEREHDVTIDVAYRYFATPNRKFIIADTPGHMQYTSNMVTGTSTAAPGLVRVDARHGLTEQSRRHFMLLSLLQAPHLALADVSRGDVIGRVKNAPTPSQDIDAMICWMANQPLRPKQKLTIKHTIRTGRAMIKGAQYRLDVNTLYRDQHTCELGLNEIGRVRVRTTVPPPCHPYDKNRATGSFVLTDEATGVTAGAGMNNYGS